MSANPALTCVRISLRQIALEAIISAVFSHFSLMAECHYHFTQDFPASSSCFLMDARLSRNGKPGIYGKMPILGTGPFCHRSDAGSPCYGTMAKRHKCTLWHFATALSPPLPHGLSPFTQVIPPLRE
ncbi:Hypothetical protein GOX0012 [Gluconobacter oxydans 621H]|uniref:Uncharacterized protein n=1 Tax=Gluconobacter oxydans (strain 621H) TaxID=290633 RepID=Q5FUY0_GLUOX|nr:Hypothetical protein GOX0012 [Gluconobacter oxydans 621H]